MTQDHIEQVAADEASEEAAISAESGPYLAQPFPVGMKPRKFAIGEVRLCPKCHGIKNKTYDKLGYMADPNGQKDEKGNRIRCERCNGWGFIPNEGL